MLYKFSFINKQYLYTTRRCLKHSSRRGIPYVGLVPLVIYIRTYSANKDGISISVLYNCSAYERARFVYGGNICYNRGRQNRQQILSISSDD